ncbi:MAG: hypothetical protein JXB09_01930 [Deltaproteobacteria bacterium]|nr:hypothetical protein [Deltaproteobacteria bacterium]
MENIIAKAVLLESTRSLTRSSIRDLFPLSDFPQGGKDNGMTLEEVEKNHIRKVLNATGGNRTQAARMLGIGLRTLQRKLKEWGDTENTPE